MWAEQSHDLFQDKMVEHILYVFSHLIYTEVDRSAFSAPALLVLDGCSGVLRLLFYQISSAPGRIELSLRTDSISMIEAYVFRD